MHNFNQGEGNLSFFLSVFLGIFAYFGQNMDVIIRVVIALGSIATAIMACRYYYYSIREKKQQIKLNVFKEKENEKGNS